MAGMTVCSDCARAYSDTDLHICPERRMAAARGFESDDSIVAQLAPSDELLNRVRSFTPDYVYWKWTVEVTDVGIHRFITVKDLSLPESLRKTKRVLLNHEDWEDALQGLGLLP